VLLLTSWRSIKWHKACICSSGSTKLSVQYIPSRWKPDHHGHLEIEQSTTSCLPWPLRWEQETLVVWNCAKYTKSTNNHSLLLVKNIYCGNLCVKCNKWLTTEMRYLPELFKSMPPKVRFTSPPLWGKVFYNVKKNQLSRNRELSRNMDREWKTKYCTSILQNLLYSIT
jgi:hypothetical protein